MKLEDMLAEAPSDFRFHLSSGALESFGNTLPLLHPRGYLQVQDIFVTGPDQYRLGFHGPGKLDGSLVNWVNGALLKEVAERAGYDVHFAPFRYRKGSKHLGSLYDTTGVTTIKMNLPILPTAIVGSYAMPGWLERLKTEYFARRISRHDLDEIHDAAAKAAIKDQEIAGLDIVTDGEPRRDNMVDYFVERLPGVQIDAVSKKFYYDFYDGVVQGKLPMASLGLVQDFSFLRSQHGARAQVLHHWSALPDQAHSQPILSQRRSARHGYRQGDEPGAQGAGESGARVDSDRRAVLFRISGRSRLGREGV